MTARRGAAPQKERGFGSRGPYQRIPRACAQANTVVANAQAADTVLVADKRSDLFSPRNVPHLFLSQLPLPS